MDEIKTLIKTVCAWCEEHLRGPEFAETISHGICPPCFDRAVWVSEAEWVKDRWEFGGEG